MNRLRNRASRHQSSRVSKSSNGVVVAIRRNLQSLIASIQRLGPSVFSRVIGLAPVNLVIVKKVLGLENIFQASDRKHFARTPAAVRSGFFHLLYFAGFVLIRK